MNERIRELADRLWRVHPSDIDAMGLKTRKEFYEHELKNFKAEIVNKCATKIVFEKDRSLGESDYMRGRRAMADSAVFIIKKHFGIEE